MKNILLLNKKIQFAIILIIACIPASVHSQINYTLTIDTADLSFQSVLERDSNHYLKVEIDEMAFLPDTGKPMLPATYLNFIIPSNTTFDSVSIVSDSSIVYNLSHPVLPAQPMVCTDCPTPDFVPPDSMVYNSSSPYPAQKIEFIKQGFFDGGNKIITISVCPFSYFPDSNQLTLFNYLSFQVHLTSSTDQGIQTRSRLARNQDIYDNALYALVDNPQDIASYQSLPTLVDEITGTGSLPAHEYVIIAKNEYIPAFDDFIEWKRSKGIDVGCVSFEDIKTNYAGDLLFPGDEIYDLPGTVQEGAGSIRQYLFESYQAGTMWVLLVGDASTLCIRYGSGLDNHNSWTFTIPNDLYFSDFTGNWNVDNDPHYGEKVGDNPDYLAEIFVGRIICSSPQDINNWVEKTIKYELSPGNGNPSYLGKCFMIQSDDFQEAQVAQKVMNHVTYLEGLIWEELPSFDDPGPYFPKGGDVVSQLNSEHYGLMGWFGHGGTVGQNSSITTMSPGINGSFEGFRYTLDAEDQYHFTGSDPTDFNNAIDNLTNTSSPFIIYSTSCTVMPFDRTKAFLNGGARNCGESFTVNNLAGGTAFLGNTRYGYITPNSDMFAIFTDLVKPPSQSYETNHISHLGLAEAISKARFEAYAKHWLCYAHNLLGCPETQIWTCVPENLEATVAPDYLFVAQSDDIVIDISNLETGKEANVILYKKDEIQEIQAVTGDQNQTAQAVFEDIVPQTTVEYHVTITSYNCLPFYTELPVAPNCQYNSTPLTISENETWINNKFYNCDIIIPPESKLSILSTVYLVPDARLIVQPGGSLIIDGGKLTNACGIKWQGIEVWGNPSAYQTSENQGQLQMVNTGTIENAETAVRVGSENYTGKGGGIVSATDGVFLDNDYGVWFDAYTHQIGNMSKFQTCNFEYNQTLGEKASFTFIKLDDVHYINFEGCSFSNNSNYEHRGYGINGFNSIFRVEGICQVPGQPCQDWDYGLFENLEYGIYATASNSTDFADIRHTDFTDNRHGIYLSGITLPRITSNHFYMGGSAIEECYGLYLNASTQYWVEDNIFEKSVGPELQSGIGIYINESGGLANEIYLNSFDNVEYGIIALGVNRTTRSSGAGLVLRCNEYENTLFDQTVVYDGINDPPPANEGIALYQGVETTSPEAEDMAGNLFYIPGPSNDDYDDLYNESNDFIYYYPENVDQAYTNVEPEDFSVLTITDVDVTLNDDWTYEDGCQSTINSGGTGDSEEMRVALATSEEKITNTEAILAALVDGGDTEELKTEVEYSVPPEAMDVYNQLISNSPYLSDTVVSTAITKENVLPNVMVRDIMVANPHTAKSAELMKKLDDRLNPLPEYMKAQILQGKNLVSIKEKIESQLAGHKAKKSKIFNRLVRYFLNDSLNPSYANDSITNLLQQDNRIYSKYNLAMLHHQNGEYQQGIDVLNNIPNQFDLLGIELSEYQEMLYLFKWGM